MTILTPDMQQVVRDLRLGFVATVCPDGTANVSPKGTIVPWDDEHLVFADIRSPGTVANLQQNPSIEVNVVNWLTRKGYRFKGTAQVLSEGEKFQEFVEFYKQRGLFDAPRRIQAIVLIHVEQVRALISPGYDQDADEEQVKMQWKHYYKKLEN
jgi:predicted pyridoxine 5'-phosphate oxidase superfamily flavin-nucleotide-binding protein